MTNKNNATMKYIIVFFTMMSICFLWIGYPYAPYKDFVLENLVSPVFLFLLLYLGQSLGLVRQLETKLIILA